MINLATSCSWDSVRFLVFSGNVFDPLIYYSHLGPLLASLVLFVFIFLANRQEFLNKLLLTLIAFFCIWSFLDLILWADNKPQHIMFIWSILIVFETVMYGVAFYFVYYFIHNNDLKILHKIPLALLYLPILFLLKTHFNLEYFDFTNCEREAAEGRLWTYEYVVEIAFVVLILFQFVSAMIGSKYKGRKKEIALVVLGTLFFLGLFSWGNIVGSLTEDWSVGQYGLFGMPIFIALLAYAIVRYQVLNIKALAVQVLVAAIIIMVGAQFFFVKTLLVQVLTGITLVTVFFFGIMLVRSIKKEVERKEELEKLSRSLAIANDRLEELDQQKSEFISIASHQLRTPLTAIRGYISLALEGSYGMMKGTPMEDVLNKLYTIDLRLSQLVEDLLNVSKIEAGKIQYKWENIALEMIAQELYDMFTVLAEKKGLKLHLIKPKEALPLMRLDMNKIKELLSNLIDNAIKYTEQGSVTIKVEQDNQVARVIIQDTGIGISQEDAERLFGKFIRTETTKKMDSGGSGLGLFIGKTFVEGHGGRVYATSEGVGKGSSFIVELPLVNPNAE